MRIQRNRALLDGMVSVLFGPLDDLLGRQLAIAVVQLVWLVPDEKIDPTGLLWVANQSRPAFVTAAVVHATRSRAQRSR